MNEGAMKRGPKTLAATDKIGRATDRADRAGSIATLVAPGTLPQQPEWLTETGREVWLDNIGRVSSAHGAVELDSDLFANFCNLQGAIAAAWRLGETPPVTALMEVRKLMELLRIAGPSSRSVKIGNGEQSTNPFSGFKRRG